MYGSRAARSRYYNEFGRVGLCGDKLPRDVPNTISSSRFSPCWMLWRHKRKSNSGARQLCLCSADAESSAESMAESSAESRAGIPHGDPGFRGYQGSWVCAGICDESGLDVISSCAHLFRSCTCTSGTEIARKCLHFHETILQSADRLEFGRDGREFLAVRAPAKRRQHFFWPVQEMH